VNSDARLDLEEDWREQSALRSALAVPVLFSQQPIGVLSLYATAANAFDDVHRRLALGIAVAIAPILAVLHSDEGSSLRAPESSPSHVPRSAVRNGTRV
jgi:hypothetical protein